MAKIDKLIEEAQAIKAKDIRFKNMQGKRVKMPWVYFITKAWWSFMGVDGCDPSVTVEPPLIHPDSYQEVLEQLKPYRKNHYGTALKGIVEALEAGKVGGVL